MARFNFNNIVRSGRADINKIGENFTKIEENGITSQEVTDAISTAKQEVTQATNTKLEDYTTTSDLKPLAKVNYSYGTAEPSGGSNGDIYDQYF